MPSWRDASIAILRQFAAFTLLSVDQEIDPQNSFACSLESGGRMANSIWTTEQFTCPSCGMNYTATREERQDKRSGSFNCNVCDTEVHTWSGYNDFFDWEAIKTKSPVFGKKRYGLAP